MENPLHLPEGTMFICGPAQKPGHEVNPDIYKLQKKLIELGHKTFNPHNNKECLDIKRTIAFAIGCTSIVTLNGWGDDPDCMKIVHVARILNIPIELSDRFLFMDDVFHSNR